ncbi:hypothetical protein ES703_49072 [subsurface metagenome]
MASQTRSAGLGQSIVMGNRAWTTPTNIYTSNNAYARTGMARGDITHWLRATTFGFSIPDGATIDGIVAEFEKRATASGISDSSVQIVMAGSEQGDERAVAGYWPTSDTYIAHGGIADLWGLGWNAAAINASNFGVSIAARFVASDEKTVYIDHVRITVYYTEVALTNMKINIGDVFKDVDEIKINVADVWKPVTGIWINIGDSWKKVFG